MELIKPGGVRPRKELETGYVPLAPPKRRTVVKDEKALQVRGAWNGTGVLLGGCRLAKLCASPGVRRRH